MTSSYPQGNSPSSPDQDRPRRWGELGDEEQVRLRVEYGRYLDRLPPTCDPESKTARFRRWLAERGIAFP